MSDQLLSVEDVRVHFPLDVVAGALLGAGLGALCALLALRLVRPVAAS